MSGAQAKLAALEARRKEREAADLATGHGGGGRGATISRPAAPADADSAASWRGHSEFQPQARVRAEPKRDERWRRREEDGASARPGLAPEDDELPAGWTEAVDAASGKVYFMNASTGQSSWDRPRRGPITLELQPPSERGSAFGSFGGVPPRRGAPPSAPVPAGVGDLDLDEIQLSAEESKGLTPALAAAALERKRREAQRARQVRERQAERLRREQEGVADESPPPRRAAVARGRAQRDSAEGQAVSAEESKRWGELAQRRSVPAPPPPPKRESSGKEARKKGNKQRQGSGAEGGADVHGLGAPTAALAVPSDGLGVDLPRGLPPPPGRRQRVARAKIEREIEPELPTEAESMVSALVEEEDVVDPILPGLPPIKGLPPPKGLPARGLPPPKQGGLPLPKGLPPPLTKGRAAAAAAAAAAEGLPPPLPPPPKSRRTAQRARERESPAWGGAVRAESFVTSLQMIQIEEESAAAVQAVEAELGGLLLGRSGRGDTSEGGPPREKRAKRKKGAMGDERSEGGVTQSARELVATSAPRGGGEGGGGGGATPSSSSSSSSSSRPSTNPQPRARVARSRIGRSKRWRASSAEAAARTPSQRRQSPRRRMRSAVVRARPTRLTQPKLTPRLTQPKLTPRLTPTSRLILPLTPPLRRTPRWPPRRHLCGAAR